MRKKILTKGNLVYETRLKILVLESMISFIFLVIIFLFGSCDKQKHNDAEYIFVTLNDNVIDASTFIKDASVIKLETNDDCLIQRISKIQYFDSKLFILDIAINSVLIFNEDGSFYKKLSKAGQGPGEYIQLIDFIIKDNFLYVMDFASQSILKYDMDFHFLEKYKYKTFGSQLVRKDSIFWLYNEPSYQKNDYQFTCLNEKDVTLNQFLQRKNLSDKFNWGDANVFAILNNNLYASPKYNSIFYHEINNNFVPVYEIRFNKNNFPKNENINDYDILSPTFNYTLKWNFFVSNKYLIFDYIYNGDRRHCFYNLKNKETNFGVVKNNIIKEFFFFPRWGNEDYLFQEVASHHVKENFIFLSNYNEKIKEIQDDDNPVIIMYFLNNNL